MFDNHSLNKESMSFSDEPLVRGSPNYIKKYVTIDYYRFLNTGTSSVVRNAKDSLTKEEMAVKIVNKKEIDGCLYEFIINEYNIMSELDHPNIAKVYFKDEDEKNLYIYMKWYKGGDMYEHTKREINYRDVYGDFKQLVDAVKYLHDRKIVHRDIKLENILIEDEKTIVLADFGYSVKDKVLEDTAGTPYYAAPELFVENFPYDGFKCDIWALGVSLFLLCVGKYPFSHPLYSRGTIRNIDLVEDLSLRELFAGVFNKDPNLRYNIDQVIDSEWMKKKA